MSDDAPGLAAPDDPLHDPHTMLSPVLRPASLALLLAGLPACSSDEATGEGDGAQEELPKECLAPEVEVEGRCLDPIRRYEPPDQLDVSNVVSYGNAELTLDLPAPPKSGFRLVVPPRDLEPGEEVETCHAWEYPELTYRNVYAARVYTSGALHHSNMYGVSYAEGGPSPYPGCTPGQGNVFTQVPKFLEGDILDVLFANSTQIEGGEQILFAPGMAFKMKTEGREAATSIHWLNVSGEPITSEIVYDFFTMPDELVETEIVPFVFDNQAFELPAQARSDIVTECSLDGTGNIVSIMPHTHKRAVEFEVTLIRNDGTEEQIFRDGAFDTDSEITVFPEPLSLAGIRGIRHRCAVENDLSRPIVWGTGDDEMCTLFGYMYPPEAEQIGYIGGRDPADPTKQADCLAANIGGYRK